MSSSRSIPIPCAAAVYVDSFDATSQSNTNFCNVLLIGNSTAARDFSSYFHSETSSQIGTVVDPSVNFRQQDKILYMAHNMTHKSSTYPTFWDGKASYTHTGNIMFFFGAEGLRILRTLTKDNDKIEAYSLDLMMESLRFEVALKPMKDAGALSHSIQHEVPVEAGAKSVYQAFFDILPELTTMATKEAKQTLKASN